jgi:hypothetical protein
LLVIYKDYKLILNNLLDRNTTLKIDNDIHRIKNGYDLSDNLLGSPTYYVSSDMIANNKRSNFLKQFIERRRSVFKNIYNTNILL